MEYIDLDFVGRKFDERIRQRLDRAVNVALDNDIEFLEVTDSAAATDILKGKELGCTQTLLAGKLLALVGDFAGFLLGFRER